MTVQRYTYRDLIRQYSKGVAEGAADTDLNPRERRLAHVLLNVASNSHWAAVEYPPTDDTRARVVNALADTVWSSAGAALVHAVSPASDDAFSTALERAVTILRGI